MTARVRWVLVLVCAVGCRGERSEQEVPVDGLPAAPRPALAFELAAPDTLGWSQTDSIRVTVRNGTRAAAGPWRLVLTLATPAVLTDTAGASAVAHESGLTRLELAIPRLAPDSSWTGWRAFRRPPAPGTGARPPAAYAIHAELLGTPLSRADTIHIRPGSAIVSGGCGSMATPSAQRYGVGPVRVHMRAAALRGACPEARDSTWRAEGNTEHGLVARPGGIPVLAVLAGDSVSRIDVTDPRLRTAAGVGVGTALADLRARYGTPCGGVGEGVVAVWFQNAPGVSFQLDSAAVRDWFRTGGGDVAELPDSARVSRFFVHGLDPRCPSAEAHP